MSVLDAALALLAFDNIVCLMAILSACCMFQMGTGLEYSEGPSLSSPQYDKTCDSGVFMPWSLDMSAEELGLPPATATLAMAPDTENQVRPGPLDCKAGFKTLVSSEHTQGWF